MEKFGEKLKALRIRSGMTLKELAIKLGFSAHGYISELESGKKTPTVNVVIKVSECFNVSTDELLKDELKIQYSSTKQHLNTNDKEPQG